MRRGVSFAGVVALLVVVAASPASAATEATNVTNASWGGSWHLTVKGSWNAFAGSPVERAIAQTTIMLVNQTGQEVTANLNPVLTLPWPGGSARLTGRSGNGRLSLASTVPAGWLMVVLATRSSSDVLKGTLLVRSGLGYGLFDLTGHKDGGTGDGGAAGQGQSMAELAKDVLDQALQGHVTPMGGSAAAPTPAPSQIDPACTALEFKAAPGGGADNRRFSITGTVKNVGTKPYLNKTGPKRGFVQLLAGEKLLSSKPLPDLQPGQTESFVVSQAWNPATAPASYAVRVGYTTDVRSDGNLDNDDRSLDNNRLEKPRSAVAALFPK